MTVLPIVARELRVASRRRSTYWLRTGAAGLVMAAGTWLFIMMEENRSSPQSIAFALFCVLTGSAGLHSLLSGVRTTADCLSEEKREGTFGLLFLTDLKGYDVVLGKLVASSVNSFYAILAIVPVLAIPVLMGGLTLGEFGRMALVVINALFLSLALGIFVSSMSRSAQKAAGVTLLLIVFITALLPWCGAIVAFIRNARPVASGFLLPSPGFNYYMALDMNYQTQGAAFWTSLVLIHGLGWLCLLLACIIAPRSWQDRPAGVQRLRWRERWQGWTFGSSAERAAFRQGLLDENAFFWLAARARLKPALVWGLLGLTAVIWVWGLAKYHRDFLNIGTYLVTAFAINLVFRGWFAGEACRQLAEDRKAGTLELILSTPLTIRDILRGQSLALQRQFLGPVLVMLVIETLLMFAGFSDASLSNSDHNAWAAVWLSGMMMLVLDLGALYWICMWQGLTSRNPARASSGSLARIFVVPGTGYAVVMLLGVLVSMGGTRMPEPDWPFFLGLWLGLRIAADVGFASLARHKLLTEFRLVAQQRFSRKRGFWKRLFSGSEPEACAVPPVVAVPK
jgi:ABC-type transport system involved in multi-copper enzyme maturation permease subunit